MSKFTKERSRKAGLPPGTLIHIGERKREKTEISIFNYDEHKLEEKEIMDVGELISFRDKPSVKWIDVDGIHQVDVLEKVGNCFGLSRSLIRTKSDYVLELLDLRQASCHEYVRVGHMGVIRSGVICHDLRVSLSAKVRSSWGSGYRCNLFDRS